MTHVGKMETTTNVDEDSYLSKGSKVQRIILHLLFRNFDIDTNMSRKKYKNIIKRSKSPQRKTMKQFMIIFHNGDKTNPTYYGVWHVSFGACHVSLMYSASTS